MVKTMQVERHRHRECGKSNFADPKLACTRGARVGENKGAEKCSQRQRHRVCDLQKIAVPAGKLENLSSVALRRRIRPPRPRRSFLRSIKCHFPAIFRCSPAESN